MSHGIVLVSSKSEALKSGIYFVFISILHVYSDKTLFMAYGTLPRVSHVLLFEVVVTVCFSF